MSAPFLVPAGSRPERGARHDVALKRSVIPPANGEIQRRLDARAYPTAHPVALASDEDKADGICGMCPHPLSSHDRISVRYCAATATKAESRGCVCTTTGTD
jgi:hypothetical protein